MNAELLEIKLEIIRRGLTQRMVAQYLGWGETQLSAVLRSARPVSRGTLKQIRDGIDELAEKRQMSK